MSTTGSTKQIEATGLSAGVSQVEASVRAKGLSAVEHLGDFVEESDVTAPVRTSSMFWVVLPVAFIALFFAVVFLARTRLVAGPMIEEIAVREASERGVDLYIGAMRPKGLFGVRFEQVRGRLRRGPYVLDTRMVALDVAPDVWESLKQGKPVPGKITLNDALIIVERDPTAAEDSTASQVEGAVDAANGLGLSQLDIVGHDVRVELRAGAFVSTRPLQIKRLDATIPLTGTPLPTKMSAYGELPDGVPFALSTVTSPDGSGHLLELKPRKPTQIDKWFAGQMPFEMTAAGLTVCSGCERDAVDFGAVELKLPNFGRGLFVTAPDAQLAWSKGQGELELGGVGIRGLRDPELGIELRRTQFSFDSASGAHSGELELREGGQGVLELSWVWDVHDEKFVGGLVADNFSLKPLLVLMDADPILHAGHLTGKFDLTTDLTSFITELSADIEFVDAEAFVPGVTANSIAIPSFSLKTNTFVDFGGRALDLNYLEVGLSEMRPLKVKAHLLDANDGWKFDITALGRDINADELVKVLPPQLAEPVQGAQIDGHFGFDLRASGHSAFPESLMLDIAVEGDVSVLHDGPSADIAALAVNGPPYRGDGSTINIPTPDEDWIAYEALPELVPRGVLAAEDAAFFRHNGFDYGGIARAMIHNLRVGRMERGGSTITQQLIKNLYLSHNRTVTRKLQEAYLTWRIEEALGKQRILEIYLNVVHWGKGIFGIRQAAEYYYGVTPEELTIDQVALLGAILPNPERFGGQMKQGKIASSRVEKFEHVMANLRYLGDITYQEYVELMSRARRGQIGGLELTICKDDEHAPEGALPCSQKAQKL